MPSTSRCAVILVVLASACACKAKHEALPLTPTAASAEAGAKPAEMLRHEILALAVRDAIIRGDLAGAQRNAFTLSGRAVFDGGTPEYQERAVALAHAASAVAASADLREAARHTAEMTQSCADCHARLSGPTWLDADGVPPAWRDMRSRMVRHDWAMYALWTGMVGNADPPWNEGAAVLADPAIGKAELVPQKTSTPEVDALAASVHDLGVRAGNATDPNARAEIYGELLATCAACHLRTR